MHCDRIKGELMLKLVYIILVALVCGGLANAQIATPAPQVTNSDENYLVMFRPGTSQADKVAVAQRSGALLRFNFHIVDAIAVRVPNVNVLVALQRNPSVLSIIPDRPVYAFQAANGKGKPGGDGTLPQVTPAGVGRVGVPTTSSNGSGIGVAVVDTGIAFNHLDLSVASACYGAFGSCQDDNGHGTHVAGIVAALDNTIDVVGVAPAAKLYAVKVLDSSGSGLDSTIIAGLQWIADNAETVNPRIWVVNMSLGRIGTVDDAPPLRQAVKALYDKGIAVVVSAGNDQSRQVSDMVPASYPEVLAVASTTALAGSNRCRRLTQPIGADTASYFTTDGIGVTISAPGEDQENVSPGCLISSVGILSTKLGGGTTRMSGTSMASPHVAGVITRMMQANVWGVENIRSALRANASRSGVAPLDSPTSSYSFDGAREGIAVTQ